jgi:hypothetical protein
MERDVLLLPERKTAKAQLVFASVRSLEKLHAQRIRQEEEDDVAVDQQIEILTQDVTKVSCDLSLPHFFVLVRVRFSTSQPHVSCSDRRKTRPSKSNNCNRRAAPKRR